MAKTPTIETVMDVLADRVTAIVPSILPETLFAEAAAWLPGPEDFPAGEVGRRKFKLTFRGLRDLSNEGIGVQNPDIADRRAAIDIEVQYEQSLQDVDVDRLIGSDAELIHRALGRSANWAGTPIKRAEISSDNRDVGHIPARILTVHAIVQYRDIEQ